MEYGYSYFVIALGWTLSSILPCIAIGVLEYYLVKNESIFRWIVPILTLVFAIFLFIITKDMSISAINTGYSFLILIYGINFIAPFIISTCVYVYYEKKRKASFSSRIL